MDTKAHRLLIDRFEHKGGTIIYPCQRHDYGCSSDDTRYTGIKHRSFTLDENGDYPFFTVPENAVELVV